MEVLDMIGRKISAQGEGPDLEPHRRIQRPDIGGAYNYLHLIFHPHPQKLP